MEVGKTYWVVLASFSGTTQIDDEETARKYYEKCKVDSWNGFVSLTRCEVIDVDIKGR